MRLLVHEILRHRKFSQTFSTLTNMKMMDVSKNNYPERLKRQSTHTHFSYIELSKIGSNLLTAWYFGPQEHYLFVFQDQREIN